MFGYIYKTTITNPKSSLNNHFYIGQKQSTKIIEGYYGSGKKLRDYFNKNCKRKWSRTIYPDEVALLGLSREILSYAENIDELNQLEAYYVDKELNNPLCMNLMTGGYGRVVKKEVIERMAEHKREAHLVYWTNGKEIKCAKDSPGPDYRKGRVLDGYNWYNNGIHNIYANECPIGYKKGTKPTTLGKKPWNKGLTAFTDTRIKQFSEKQKGRTVSENTRKKLSTLLKNKHFSQKTEWVKGNVPWNKGTKGVCKPNRTSFCGETRGMKWWNNGTKQIRSFSKPDGAEWTRGMLKINFRPAHYDEAGSGIG